MLESPSCRAPEQDFDFEEARQRATNVLGDARCCALCGEMQTSLRRLEVRPPPRPVAADAAKAGQRRLLCRCSRVAGEVPGHLLGTCMRLVGRCTGACRFSH